MIPYKWYVLKCGFAYLRRTKTNLQMAKVSKATIYKTVRWAATNYIAGFAPMLMMIIMKSVRQSPEIERELFHLANDGLPLFVSCAIMASVVFDTTDEAERINNWFTRFFFTKLPYVVFAFLLLVYILVIVGWLPEHYFGYQSWVYIFILSLSNFYSILARIYCYHKEELKWNKRLI